MAQNNEHGLVETCLKEHRSEILTHWDRRLNMSERFLLFRMSENVQLTLNGFFNEIVAIYTQRRMTMPKLPPHPIPRDAAQNEVHILLVGEEVFVETLEEHLKASPAEWIAIRREINTVFHEALRNNSLTTCDCCRWAVNEDLAQLEKLESALKQKEARSV